MRALFTLTTFLGAALLFLVQPIVARMALPLLGGSPAVWNTCMVFFQAVLLVGRSPHGAPVPVESSVPPDRRFLRTDDSSSVLRLLRIW